MPSDRRLLFVIFFAALALCVLLTKRHVVSWNDGSRIATVDALTSQRTFRIDGSPFAVGLGDEIRFRGATYSDKPPLLSILAAGVAFALAPLGITLRHTPGTAIYLVTLFTVGVAFAGGCAYAYALQRSLGFGRRLALAVSALTGTATLALPYATVLTNHVPAGAAGLAAVNHMLRARNGRLRNTLFAGFFYGLTFAFDAAAAILAISGAVLLIGAPLRRWVLCTCAAIPLVAFQLAYNRAISGSVVPTVFNAHAWSDPSLPLHWWSSHIFEVFSPLQYARFTVDLLVGVRGLLSFTPLVAVAVYGFVRLWRSDADGRRLASAVAATFVVYFLAIVFLQNDSWAQNFGERRFVDVLFLLSIGLGPALAAARGALALAAVRAATVTSVAIAALGTVAPFAGRPGQSGFSFAPVEFARLAARAPAQAAVDVVLLVAMVAFVLWLVQEALRPSAPPSQPRYRRPATAER